MPRTPLCSFSHVNHIFSNTAHAVTEYVQFIRERVLSCKTSNLMSSSFYISDVLVFHPFSLQNLPTPTNVDRTTSHDDFV